MDSIITLSKKHQLHRDFQYVVMVTLEHYFKDHPMDSATSPSLAEDILSSVHTVVNLFPDDCEIIPITVNIVFLATSRLFSGTPNPSSTPVHVSSSFVALITNILDVIVRGKQDKSVDSTVLEQVAQILWALFVYNTTLEMDTRKELSRIFGSLLEICFKTGRDSVLMWCRALVDILNSHRGENGDELLTIPRMDKRVAKVLCLYARDVELMTVLRLLAENPSWRHKLPTTMLERL